MGHLTEQWWVCPGDPRVNSWKAKPTHPDKENVSRNNLVVVGWMVDTAE